MQKENCTNVLGRILASVPPRKLLFDFKMKLDDPKLGKAWAAGLSGNGSNPTSDASLGKTN